MTPWLLFLAYVGFVLAIARMCGLNRSNNNNGPGAATPGPVLAAEEGDHR